METQQQRVTAVSRKRSKESVSSIQSEVPTAKKKKLMSRDKEGGRPGKRPDSAPPPEPSLALLPSSKEQEEDVVVAGSSPQLQVGEEASQASSAATSTAAAKRKPPKNWYLKPQRPSPGSWMAHMGSLLVHRCAQRADACGLDPRDHLSDINWSKMVDGLLLPQDLHLIWYFIRREYSDISIPEILDTTRPYAELSVDTLHREEIRIKYKDLLPKGPLSPYLLFMKSKQPKLKQKYPNLLMTEVATKIGKKWSALPKEKKEKYKQQHTLLKASYEVKLKEFYDEHPDARPQPKQPSGSRSKKVSKAAAVADTETEEQRRIKELKAQLPKQPLSAYLHFCKKKREKLHRKYPDLPPNAVTVKLGKRWQSMDTEARIKYTKLHEENVERYKEDLAIFNSEHPDAQEILAKSRKKRKPKVLSAKQRMLTVGEDGKVAATSSPPLPNLLSQSTSATTTSIGSKEAEGEEEDGEGGEEVVEGEGEVEEEEGEEEEEDMSAQRESQHHQNGGGESSSDSETAESSTEN